MDFPVQSRTSFLKVKERLPTSWDSAAQTVLLIVWQQCFKVLMRISHTHTHTHACAFSVFVRESMYLQIQREIQDLAQSCWGLWWEPGCESHIPKPRFFSQDCLYIIQKSILSSPSFFPVHIMRVVEFSKMDLSRSTHSHKSIASSGMHN